MKLFPYQRDAKQHRFPLPNEIWKWKLKPPAFAILAYLQYRHCRKFSGTATPEELAEHTRMSVEMAQSSVESLLHSGLLTANLVPILSGVHGGRFFTMPDEVFYLGLGHGAITVYAYLLCCEDRRSHQCHPSYNTISSAVGLAVNTVMKHMLPTPCGRARRTRSTGGSGEPNRNPDKSPCPRNPSPVPSKPTRDSGANQAPDALAKSMTTCGRAVTPPSSTASAWPGMSTRKRRRSVRKSWQN